jgi:hypothetical protein
MDATTTGGKALGGMGSGATIRKDTATTKDRMPVTVSSALRSSHVTVNPYSKLNF